jgi:o-succinylbenzoate---CoA ligase
VQHWIARAAATHPGREAVGGLTYASLYEGALGAAGALRERGVRPGERVALALPPGGEFAAALHGCLLAGAVAVPIDLRLAPDERDARTAGARIVVEDYDEDLAGRGAAHQEPLHLDAVATLMHTSGTTAAPRPVPLTYGNWLANALGSAVALGLDPAERWLCPMPLAHVGGLSILLRSAI